jgi:hypothetical protein
MHDYLTGTTISGSYDLPPHGVLVVDEHLQTKGATTSAIPTTAA